MELTNKDLLQIFVVLTIASEISSTSDMDVKRHFCGSILSATISELCKRHNEPYSGYYYRRKRAVADECCVSPCSKRHLKEYYCAEPRSSDEIVVDNYYHHKGKTQFQLKENNTKVSNEIIQGFTSDAAVKREISTLQVRQKSQRRRNRIGYRRATSNNNKEYANHTNISSSNLETNATTHIEQTHVNINKKKRIRGKRNCTCRKRRAKENKLMKPVKNYRNVIRPPPQVGVVEDNSQRPMHVRWLNPSLHSSIS